jgi:orotidine-5'-phosphate decarboxylase
MNESRVAFAVDVPTLAEARPLLAAVGGAVGMAKIGLEMFVEAGPAAVRLGEEAGLPIFLDLKLCDIPETVDRAVARAAGLGARMLTIHAGGGKAMVRRAAERARKEATGLEIVAVTVLTSLDQSDLASLGVAGSVDEHVERLARMAMGEGVRAFVCSPHEAQRLRVALGAEATLITPGVRPASAAGRDDQKRTMTAADAIRAGADWVVVGRPIRDAADPAAAARAVAREVADALATRGANAA